MTEKLVVECMICGKRTAGVNLPIQLCRRCAAVLHGVIVEKKEICNDEK